VSCGQLHIFCITCPFESEWWLPKDGAPSPEQTIMTREFSYLLYFVARTRRARLFDTLRVRGYE
jgi:hypothetical protein